MASSKHAYPRRPSFTIFILASVIAILAVPLSSLGVSLWSNSAVPATASFADNNAYEIGVKFTSDVSGYVTGIRFYKGSGNTGTHIGHLWTNTGTLLASATFTNETASGWQQVSFAQPVLISANTVYVASYWDPKGNYALTRPYFTTEYNNAPLHALADGAAGPNGAYLWNGSGLPNSGYDASNYWVDIVFVPATQTSLWSNSTVPATASFSDNNAYEIGLKFTSDVSGYVTGIRFYKGSGNTGTHIGHLWTTTGKLLASATFTNETASGWQQVSFAQPVLIAANTVYVASYWDPTGNYALTRPYFTAEYNNAPLHALADGAAGPNGAYLWNSSGLPNSGYGSSNYWVDVKFSPLPAATLLGTPDATISSISPTSGPLSGGTLVTIDGAGFESGTAVSFGGANASSVAVISSTQLTAVTPAGPEGAVNVTATDPGSGDGSLADGFMYLSDPTVSGVSPSSGLTTGGTTVTISGTGFQSGVMVVFGAILAASVTVMSPTQIQAVTPAESAGSVGITITNPDAGTASLPSAFSFVAPTQSVSSLLTGPLLTGMTPSNYKVPSGWTLVSTVNFEGSSLPSGWSIMGGSIECTFAHSGSCALRNPQNYGDEPTGIDLSGSAINSREAYESWWEYEDPQARMNLQTILSRRVDGSITDMLVNWEDGGNGCYTQCIDTQFSYYDEGNGTTAPNFGVYGGTYTFPAGQWVQYEVHFKANDPGNDNGEVEFYENGKLIFAIYKGAPNINTSRCAVLNGSNDCGDLVGNADMTSADLNVGGYNEVVANYLNAAKTECASQDNGGVANTVVSNFASPPCSNEFPSIGPGYPAGQIPTWNRYIDDVIVLKKNGVQ